MTARRAIKALAYLWIVLATVLLAIDALSIAREPPPPDMWDFRYVGVFVFGVPWLLAVVAVRACLSKMRASPRSHAPVWWLVLVLAADGCLLVVVRAEPVAHWIGGGAVLLTATAVGILDIIDLRTIRRRRADGSSLRAG